MKLRYILSEDINIQKHQAQLDAVSKRVGIPQEDLINYLNEMDPNGKYTRWILKQIKFQNITIPEDNHRVREVLQQFDQNKQRLEVKDIMQYKRVSDLEDALELVLGTGSKRKKALQYNPEALPGVEKIAEEGPLTLYHVTDANSLAELGEGTKLCTRKSFPDCQAAEYINNKGPIYIITKDNKLFAQIAVGTLEVKDTKNKAISIATLPPKIITHTPSLALLCARINKTRIPEAEPYIMKNPKTAYYYALNILQAPWPEAEPTIMKDPENAYYYALYIMDGERWPEAEPTIMKDPEYAYKYALNFIGNPGMDDERWPEAEPYIMKSPVWAYHYALDIMHRERWPEAEPTIMKDPEYAYKYALDIMRGKRWPEAEPVIMKDPEYAYAYILNIIEGPWPQAEPIIMKDPEYAYYYALHIMDGERWPEAEPYIMKDPEYAYRYAQDILKAPWPEAEPYIMKDPEYAYYYALHIMGGERWPEAEPVIAQVPIIAYKYILRILHGKRWPEAEPYMMKDPEGAVNYAINIIEGPWPEAEPYIKLDSHWYKQYKQYIKNKTIESNHST